MLLLNARVKFVCSSASREKNESEILFLCVLIVSDLKKLIRASTHLPPTLGKNCHPFPPQRFSSKYNPSEHSILSQGALSAPGSRPHKNPFLLRAVAIRVISGDCFILDLRGNKGEAKPIDQSLFASLFPEVSISLWIKESKYVRSQRRDVSLNFARFKHLEKIHQPLIEKSMNTYKVSAVQKETP